MGRMLVNTKEMRARTRFLVRLWQSGSSDGVTECLKIYRKSVLGLLTVCPGSSDPPEKLLNISASENEVYTIF